MFTIENFESDVILGYHKIKPVEYAVYETVYKITCSLYNIDCELKFLNTGDYLCLKGKNSTSIRIDVESQNYVITLIDDQGYNGFLEISRDLDDWHHSEMPPVRSLEIQRPLTPFYKRQWWELVDVDVD